MGDRSHSQSLSIPNKLCPLPCKNNTAPETRLGNPAGAEKQLDIIAAGARSEHTKTMGMPMLLKLSLGAVAPVRACGTAGSGRVLADRSGGSGVEGNKICGGTNAGAESKTVYYISMIKPMNRRPVETY